MDFLLLDAVFSSLIFSDLIFWDLWFQIFQSTFRSLFISVSSVENLFSILKLWCFWGDGGKHHGLVVSPGNRWSPQTCARHCFVRHREQNHDSALSIPASEPRFIALSEFYSLFTRLSQISLLTACFKWLLCVWEVGPRVTWPSPRPPPCFYITDCKLLLYLCTWFSGCQFVIDVWQG